MRGLRSACCLLLALGLATVPAAADPSDRDVLAGIVHDGLGNLLTGVEVLIVGPSRAAEPLAVVRSDGEGRFRLPRLAPGAYRIAAVKDGYLTYVGRVDTAIDRWIDVVLQPMPALDEELPAPVPEDSSWTARLPRRYVLHEQDEGTDADPPAGAGSFLDGLEMQVDRLVAVGPGWSGRAAAEGSDVQGSETRVDLSSVLGERAALRLEGWRESFDSTRHPADEAPSWASRDATTVSLGFDYEPRPGEQTSVRGLYGSRSVELAAPVSGAVAPLDAGPSISRQARRYWSYDAAWSRRIARTGALAVELDYHGATVVPQEFDLPSEVAPASAETSPIVTSRTFGAAGTYETAPAPDHEVQLDFRARVLEVPEDGLRLLGSDAGDAFRVPPGLTMGFDARDTWSPGGPLSVTFGLGLRQARGPLDAALVIPRLGGAWTSDAFAVRFVVSYHGLTGADPVAVDRAAPFRTAGAIGWDTAVELPLGSGLRLTGAARYTPIELADPASGPANPRPTFLSDGNAAVREQTVALQQDAGDTRTSLEYTRGEVTGTVAAILSWDLPLQRLGARAMTYDTGRLRVRVVPSGTDVTIEYQKLVEDEAAGAAATRDSIELRILQNLLTARSLGSWRFLMALRAASVDVGPGGGRVGGDDAALLSALDHRLSAGLSFVF